MPCCRLAAACVLSLGLTAPHPAQAVFNIVEEGAADFRTPPGASPCTSLNRTDCWWQAFQGSEGMLFRPLGRLPNGSDLTTMVRGLDVELPAGSNLNLASFHLTWGPGPFGLYAVPGAMVQRGDLLVSLGMNVGNSSYTQASGILRSLRTVVGNHLWGLEPSDLDILPGGLFVQDGGRHEVSGALVLGGRTDFYGQPASVPLDGEYRLQGGVLQVPLIGTHSTQGQAVLRIDGGLLTSPITTGRERLVVTDLHRVAVGSQAGRQGELFLTQARFSNLGQLDVGVDGGRGSAVLTSTPIQTRTLRVGVDAAGDAASSLALNFSLLQADQVRVGQGSGAGGWLSIANGSELQVAGALDIGYGAAGVLELRGDARLRAGTLNLGPQATVYLWAAPTVSGGLRTDAGSRVEVRENLRFDGEIAHEGHFEMRAGRSLQLGGPVRGAGSFAGAVQFEGDYAPGELQAVAFGGDVRFTDGAVLTLRLGGVQAGEFDQLLGMEGLDFRGQLVLEFLDGFAAADGALLPLLGFETLTKPLDPRQVTVTGFDAQRLDLLRLASTGELAIAAVPEPQTWVLMGLGLLALGRPRSSRRGGRFA